MNWRLHISNQPLRRVNLLPGNQPQVAVTETRTRVRFYDAASGAHYSDLELDVDLLDRDEPAERRAGLQQLRAPNQAYLPLLEFGSSYLYTSNDGQLHLIHDQHAGISLEVDDDIIPLDVGSDSEVLLVALERELGTIAALTGDQRLHIFQQQTRQSTFSLGDTAVLNCFLVNGGSQLVLVEPDRLRLLDTTGKTLLTQSIHYAIGLAAISSNGNWLVVSDAEYQLLRLYNYELVPVRQQHAIDLLMEARQLQLFANYPADFAPISALDITNSGLIAFALGGTLCVTHTERLTALPQPRRLL
ncbi:MAG: hypothetical protein HC915_08215 [Anaerolineae bacterium]|nr:hypothetical protein [Anaerolineae bacterium]